MFVALLFALTLTAGTAAAQPAPFNATGVTMGHWHLASKDLEANKKIFLAMGGKLYMPGGNPLIMFPGLYINLNLGTEKGEGGSQGSVVNHVGFIVDNVQARVAQWKAAACNKTRLATFSRPRTCNRRIAPVSYWCANGRSSNSPRRRNS